LDLRSTFELCFNISMNPDRNDARLPVAVIGAGAIGRMHLERMALHPDVQAVAIADAGPAAKAVADAVGVPFFNDHRELLAKVKPRAVIVATPNDSHAAVGIDCLRAGAVTLMEKPVASTLAEGEALCKAARETGVPLLVGHQRRHNPILQRARELIEGGAIGRPVAASVMATWLKPDAYFELAWRRERGGGPVLINLIHDIDMLRFLLGEVESVQAMASNAVRGFAVEDTAAATLRFGNGALASMVVTDAAVAPWNWDLAAGEAAHYAQQSVDSHFICGTEGSLTLPQLTHWRYAGARGWHEPLTAERTALHRRDPYVEQLRHLRAVAEGREAPLCSGEDGLGTLRATLAVLDAAKKG
jgi:predicted dehydrogenase